MKYDYEIYCDGATEPINPGGACGIGCIVFRNGELIKEYSYFVSQKPNNTNNIAEYMAFIRALKFIKEEKLLNKNIIIRGDSMLCINQLKGNWQIKNGAYLKYAFIAKKLLKELPNNIFFEWIPREKNQIADDLSKKELIKNGITITKRN
jgi:ribonuclease HI